MADKKKTVKAEKKAAKPGTRKETAPKPSKKKASTPSSPKKTKEAAVKATAASGKAAPSAPAAKQKGKAALSPREEKIQAIKAKLLKQREALLNEAEVALNELPGQTIFPDLGDQASAETDRNFMLRLRGREQRLLKKIDEAVDRIDSGTFGICEDCGNEIDIKRLDARPVTTMCIECKTLQEEEERLREA